MTKIVLWGTKASPFVRKVMLALYEKELSFEQLEVLPSSFLKVIKKEPLEKFSTISPLGKIPAIEIDNFHIADSAIIIQYLEHKFAETTKLYPTEVENFAKEEGCDMMELIARPGWQRVLNLFDYKRTHVVLEKKIKQENKI